MSIKKTGKTITPPKKSKVELVEELPKKEVKLLIVDTNGKKIDAATKEEKEGFKRYLGELKEQKDIDTFGDIIGVAVKKRILTVEIEGGNLDEEKIKEILIQDFKEVDFQPEDRSLELALYEKKKKAKDSPNGDMHVEDIKKKILEGESSELPVKKEKTYPYTFKFVPYIDGRIVQFREKEKTFLSTLYNNYNNLIKDKPYKLSFPGIDDNSLTLRLVSTTKLSEDEVTNIKIDLVDHYTLERLHDVRDIYLRIEENSKIEVQDNFNVVHISSHHFNLVKYTKELEDEMLDKLFDYGTAKHKGVKQKRVRCQDRQIIVTLECTKFENAQNYINELMKEFITLELVERKIIVYLQLCVTDKNNIVLENMNDRKQKDILTVIDSVLDNMDNKFYSFGTTILTNGILEIPLKMKKFKIDTLEELLIENLTSVLEGSDTIIHFTGSTTREEITNEKIITFSIVDQNDADINNLTDGERKGIQAAFIGIIQPIRDATENFLEINVNGSLVIIKLTTKNNDLGIVGKTIASLFSDSNIQVENRLLLLKYRSHKG